MNISPTRFCRSAWRIEGEGDWKLSESWLGKGFHSSVHIFITYPPPFLGLKATVHILYGQSPAILRKQKADISERCECHYTHLQMLLCVSHEHFSGSCSPPPVQEYEVKHAILFHQCVCQLGIQLAHPIRQPDEYLQSKLRLFTKFQHFKTRGDFGK